MTVLVATVVAGGAGVRLHQRLSRRGELDRHRRLDARAVAALRRALGGVLQLRRLPRLPDARRDHDRQGRRRPEGDRHGRRVRRAHRRHRLGPDHLVVRHPVELVARADRRARRRRRRQAGAAVLDAAGLTKIGLSIVLSPLLGLALGFSLMVAVFWIFRRFTPARVDACSGACSSSRRRSTASATAATTRRRRWASSPCCSTRTDSSATRSTSRSGSCWRATPRWGSARCRAAGASCGRWGCGSRSCKPVGGFCAETGGAITLFLATHLGIPVSTTHTITGAIVGVGSVQNTSAVRWGVRRPDRLGLDAHDPLLGLHRGAHLDDLPLMPGDGFPARRTVDLARAYGTRRAIARSRPRATSRNPHATVQDDLRLASSGIGRGA